MNNLFKNVIKFLKKKEKSTRNENLIIGSKIIKVFSAAQMKWY